MPVHFSGEIKARVVEVRFAIAGKILNVNKRTGDYVKKWDTIASLERKILQTELDKELQDYEKVRADFEIFVQKNPNPTEMIDKYLKTEKNAELNASVKQVELAKEHLEQSMLLSPVDGIVVDDSSVVPGLFVTPANSPMKIVDTSSYYFGFEIDEKNIHDFLKPRKCKISLISAGLNLEAETAVPLADGKAFTIRVPLDKHERLFIGMKGDCAI